MKRREFAWHLGESIKQGKFHDEYRAVAKRSGVVKSKYTSQGTRVVMRFT